MKKLLFLLILATAASCNNSSKTQTATTYQCPMDCEEGKTYEKPGKCPVCEMDLEEVKK